MRKTTLNILCILILLVFSINFVSAILLNLDKNEYNPHETSTAELTVDIVQDKNKAYNISWFLPNGTIISDCTFIGTTPNGVGVKFYESCSLPTGIYGYNNAYSYIELSNGNNATDYFNITTSAPAGSLSIQDILIRHSDIYLGEWQAVRGFVVDEGGNYSMGVKCDIQIRKADETPIDIIPSLESDSEGEVYGVWYLDPQKYDVESYTVKLSCWCSDSPSYTCQLYGASTGGHGVTSFTVYDVVDTHYENDSYEFLEIDDGGKFAGFDDIIVTHNRTNNYGDVMQTLTTYWFANIDSEQDFHYDYLENVKSTLNLGTTITEHNLDLPPDLTNGIYRVEYETYYYYESKLKKVEKYFSKSFNVTAVAYSSIYNEGLIIKDYNKQPANQSTSAFITRPENFIVAGDNVYICMNITNLMSQNYICSAENMVLINEEIDREITVVNNYISPFNEFVTKRTILTGTQEYCSNFKFPYVTDSSGNWRVQGGLVKGTTAKKFVDQINSFLSNYFYIQLPIIIHNITTDAYGTSITACDEMTINVSYDYFGKNEDKYIAKFCFQNTDDDVILKCENKEIDFDYGENKVFLIKLKTPYVYSNVSGEVDISIFDDEGDLVVFGDTEPYNTFNVTYNGDDSCKYELDERNTRALEGLFGNYDNYSDFLRSYQNSFIDIKDLIEESQDFIKVELEYPKQWVINNTYTVYATIKDFAGDYFTPTKITMTLKNSEDKQIYLTKNPNIENPGIYKMIYTVPSEIEEGTYTIVVTVQDETGLVGNAIGTVDIFKEQPPTQNDFYRILEAIFNFFKGIWEWFIDLFSV